MRPRKRRAEASKSENAGATPEISKEQEFGCQFHSKFWESGLVARRFVAGDQRSA